MRGFGWILLLLGAGGLVWALNLDTTVGSKPYYSDLDDRWMFPRERYHNIGLMNEKQNSIIAASVVAVIGVLLVIAGYGRGRAAEPAGEALAAQVARESTKQCPDCAEVIRLEARICRFCKRQFTDQEMQAQPVATRGERPLYCRQCGAKWGASFDACQRCGEDRDPAWAISR